MQVPPFDIPDEVFIDPKTGYAVSIPLGYQGYPGWRHDQPEVIQRIQLLRRELSIVIDDYHFIQPPQDARQLCCRTTSNNTASTNWRPSSVPASTTTSRT